jgi:hypothetical protein
VEAVKVLVAVQQVPQTQAVEAVLTQVLVEVVLLLSDTLPVM